MEVEFLAEDLLPGDRKSAERDWSDVKLRVIHGIKDPFFETAFQRLWEEFGPLGEMESPTVLEKRFQWDPKNAVNGCALFYQMILATSGDAVAAVRDHTAIVLPEQRRAIVHLSHVLVAPEWRRSGIAGWLRALPIQTARHALRAQKLPETSPILLAGEMEKPNENDTRTTIRLKAYEKAGYLKIDPAAIHYLQPDFRSPEAIDASGGAIPLPMTLIVRRVGHETETTISGGETKDIVEAFYRMYGMGFRDQDMKIAWDSLKNYPSREETIRLIPPTQ